VSTTFARSRRPKRGTGCSLASSSRRGGRRRETSSRSRSRRLIPAPHGADAGGDDARGRDLVPLLEGRPRSEAGRPPAARPVPHARVVLSTVDPGSFRAEECGCEDVPRVRNGVEDRFRYCPWCAAPQRRKLVEVLRAASGRRRRCARRSRLPLLRRRRDRRRFASASGRSTPPASEAACRPHFAPRRRRRVAAFSHSAAPAAAGVDRATATGTHAPVSN
jgi:hypothetical protein